MKIKSVIFNLGAITLAFALGISINQACADSLETLSDSELRQLVSRLQTEVNNLKQEVANLKAQIGSISSVQTYSGEFEVDGLWFSRSGQITSRPMRWEEKISTRSLVSGE